MRFFFPLLPLLLVTSALRGDVVINELQTSNGSTLLDEDGDASDWIELINRGESEVDLEGWGLSDRPDNPWKWIFPSVVLPPGERLLVWASGKDRGSEISEPETVGPEDIPGLVLRLTAEGSGYEDGDPVPLWSDSSGMNNHAFAPTLSARPVFRANRLNGLPVLEFTKSSGHHLRLPTEDFAGMEHLGDFSAFVVARWTGGVPAGLLGAWGGAGNTGNSHFEINSGGQLRLRVADMDTSSSNGTLSVNEWAVVGGDMRGSGDNPLGRLFKNGGELTSRSKSPGSTSLANYGFFAIGTSHDTRQFNGEIAEFLIYNRSLSAEERTFVSTYLATRYGFSAPTPAPALHTNFSISSEGESIILTQPDGVTADFTPPVAVPRDCSYGRSPDGTGDFAYFSTPTPGGPNATSAYGPPLPQPTLSHARGFQETPFQLTITHPEPGATLRYTLDGSEPTPENGSDYVAPIPINTTTVVRAAAFKDGSLPLRAIATATYLFADDVIQVTGKPAGYPSTWNGFSGVSYGISPFVASQPGYQETMKEALRALPTVSISIAPEDMFGSGGVYSNPTIEGLEKAASVEWIAADGSWDVQTDAGLRVQGGASRQFSNSPKKSLRLLFKSDYGDGRLRVPVLRDGGSDLADFNSLVLRAEYNNSWLHWDGAQRLRGTNFRDQWMRDTQIAMSGSGSSGVHVHLYINGIYWGVYNPSERADAAFSASHFGGEREDYDAMTHDGVRDGNNIAWNAMRSIAQSGLASSQNYDAIRSYLDVDHFIDYMILNIYAGNEDWPHNNWNATRKREPGAGYRFFVWDAERSLEGLETNRVNVTGTNNPAEFYAALRENAEFRLRFADRVHRHFFNGGALTPDACIQRYSSRAAVVQAGIFGEQARWGAYRHEIFDRGGPSPRYALNPHWLAEHNRLVNVYFPARTGIVLNQFRSAGLYPFVEAPSFSIQEGQFDEAQEITVSAPQGVIRYTLDGSDPREPGAATYDGPLWIDQSVTLKARVLHNGEWSALNEASFIIGQQEPVFLPGGSADWTEASNWSPAGYPDGAGSRALIPSPASGDRNIDLRRPVTVGRIRFQEGSSPWRDRLRDRSTGNTLTFNGASDGPMIAVEGEGTGYVELEVEAGVHLAGELELRVDHRLGDPEHGALRLRSIWEGPGGLRKTGVGIASLTGADKNFTGPLIIEEGVLQLTQPSTPPLVSEIDVKSGGQLRLVSGGSGETRVYDFPVPVQIAGAGRGPEIPENSGGGKLGALRYDPGSGFNHAVVTSPVVLTADASLHVDGSGNLLELTGGLSGLHALTKSGGGVVRLHGDNPNLSGPLHVTNGKFDLAGSLAAPVELQGTQSFLSGYGIVGPISGSGTVELDGTLLRSTTLDGASLSVVFRQSGSPDHLQPASARNGVLVLDEVPAARGPLRIYLAEYGDRFRGGLFTPFPSDLASSLGSAPVEVYLPDPEGGHLFANVTWSLASGAQVVTVPETADFGDGPVLGRTIEVRLDAPPASYAAWLFAHFPDPEDRENPDLTDPSADPTGSGVPNLIRYALGIGPFDPHGSVLPRLELHDGTTFRFPFDPGRDDVIVWVESTTDLEDWTSGEILFDSRTDPPASLADGWMSIHHPSEEDRRFFRIKVLQKPNP